MLGRLKRTSRLDVGLALGFTGAAFLMWSVVAGVSRNLMYNLVRASDLELPPLSAAVKWFFADAGFIIDIVGLAWMFISLLLIFLANRQKISISWGWITAGIQSLVAVAGAMLVGWAVSVPFFSVHANPMDSTMMEIFSMISLPIVIIVALLVWILFVVWMLIERRRLERRGPSLSDSLRTNR